MSSGAVIDVRQDDDSSGSPHSSQACGSRTASGPQQPFVTSKSSTRGRRLSLLLDPAHAKQHMKAQHSSSSTSPKPTPVADDTGATGATAASQAASPDPAVLPLPSSHAGGACLPAAPVKRAVNITAACLSCAGREPSYKRVNQDNCFAFERYLCDDEALFGTMDGHGPNGHLVSAFLKHHLPILLQPNLAAGAGAPAPTPGITGTTAALLWGQPGEADGPTFCAERNDPATAAAPLGGTMSALTAAFLAADAALGESDIDCELSGSTAVVAHLKGKTLTTAWVGDSRAVVGRRSRHGWEAVELSNDHKPSQPAERARILRAQGRVERLVDEYGEPMGPHRVWVQYAWIPGLAMSRALGDQLAHQVGVISDPSHASLELTPADRFLILASDGVWEFISCDEAVSIVAKCGESAEAGCRQLVSEAQRRWMRHESGISDDITVVIAHFDHIS